MSNLLLFVFSVLVFGYEPIINSDRALSVLQFRIQILLQITSSFKNQDVELYLSRLEVRRYLLRWSVSLGIFSLIIGFRMFWKTRAQIGYLEADSSIYLSISKTIHSLMPEMAIPNQDGDVSGLKFTVAKHYCLFG